jgi:hypothetical protein
MHRLLDPPYAVDRLEFLFIHFIPPDTAASIVQSLVGNSPDVSLANYAKGRIIRAENDRFRGSSESESCGEQRIALWN